MSSDRIEKSSDVLQAYLSYLQEMSRKISSRTGMENVLYGKTKKNYHYYFPFDNNEVSPDYLKNVNVYLGKETERKLFLGNGLFIGVLRKNRTKKYIAAPLIYSLANIETDGSGRSFTCEIECDSISLNYDFVTLVLDRENEDGETIAKSRFYSEGIDTASLDAFEDIEKYLEDLFKQENIAIYSLKISIAIQVFEQIKKVSEFSHINFATEKYIPEIINGLGQRRQEGLTFYSHRFFYVANLPGQLSTYTALRKMILEVS